VPAGQTLPPEPQLPVLVVSGWQTSPAAHPAVVQSTHLPPLQVSQAGQSVANRHAGAQCPAVAPGRTTQTFDPEQGVLLEQAVSATRDPAGVPPSSMGHGVVETTPLLAPEVVPELLALEGPAPLLDEELPELVLLPPGVPLLAPLPLDPAVPPPELPELDIPPSLPSPLTLPTSSCPVHAPP
jgi:hypothetical protein